MYVQLTGLEVKHTQFFSLCLERNVEWAKLTNLWRN